MDGESQHVHGGEQHGEVLFAVAEIMFEMIAVILRMLKLSFSIFHLALAQVAISATFSRETLSEVTKAPS